MAFATRTDVLRASAMLSPAYLWLTAAIFLPLSAMLFFSVLTAAPFGARDWHFTSANYIAFLQRTIYPNLLAKSLGLSAVVTGFCVLIGYPAAYILAKQIKGRSREALFLLIILPFWSNSLVRIFSWAIVLRSHGLVETALQAILPFDFSMNLMFSYNAIVIGLVHSYLPYIILTTYVALQGIDDSLVDAARSLGAPFLTIFWRILLPLSLPGLVAGAVLTFVPVAGSFMEARILGGRSGTLYGTLIEDQFVAVFNWPLGAALSFILLAVVFVILAASAPMLRRART
jgi:spermidine/putrescine transport system permease protein